MNLVASAHVRRAILSLAIAASVAASPATVGGVTAASARPEAAPRSNPHAVPGVVAGPRDALTRAWRSGALTDAEYALYRAESLFHLGRVRARFGDVQRAAGVEATLILRDLALRQSTLTGAERRMATQVLARPTDGVGPNGDPAGNGYSVSEAAPVCSTNACVHYVTTTGDAPDVTTDSNPANGIPDYVDTTSDVVQHVWDTEVTDLGFRAPKSDATSDNNGGNAKLDVYLANIGPDGLYGYCTSDDPHVDDIFGGGGSYQFFDVSAYCVVDNDFDVSEFPFGANGVEALEVTLAHEFFHAVQFSYDVTEEPWFLESGAVRMEDWVYDAINDNRQYLPESAIAKPTISLDKSSSPGFSMYGDWVFWEYLTEYLGAPGTPDMTVLRRAWHYADGASGGPDFYSSLATAKAVHEQIVGGAHWELRKAFALFGAWNAAARHFYAEGQAGSYPSPPVEKTAILTGSKLAMAKSSYLLNHLTDRYVVVKPGTGIHANATLKIHLIGPDFVRGTEASAVVFKQSGAVSIARLKINTSGDGNRTVAFGKGTVTKVVIVLTNASARVKHCFSDFNLPVYSCYGDPLDDHQSFAVSATVIQ